VALTGSGWCPIPIFKNTKVIPMELVLIFAVLIITPLALAGVGLIIDQNIQIRQMKNNNNTR
jgi:hypothetical protein